MLGMLFGGTVVLVLFYVVLWTGFPIAGRIIGGVILGVLILKLTRDFLILRKLRRQRAPIGPLSADERSKARSKLVKPPR